MKLTVTALMFAVAALPALAQPPEPPHPRDRGEATAVVRGLRRIVTPNGIEQARTIRIGGIDQFVTIREVSRAAVETLGVPPDAVRIIVTEVAPEHWGVGPRTMADLRRGAGEAASAKTS